MLQPDERLARRAAPLTLVSLGGSVPYEQCLKPPPSVLSEFKDYAYFSVRVDRFFSVVSIYGMHHDRLKLIYKSLPSRDKLQAALSSDTDEEIKQFLGTSSFMLSYMATSNIFESAGDQAGGDIGQDALNFAFYTCYCFQWSLFEDFTKTIIRKAIDANVFVADVVTGLEANWRRTKQFFDKIHSGEVFGRSPYTAVLPVMSWVPTTEHVGYDDLNAIRELRNAFIHGVENPEITTEDIAAKQRRYNRSMWILRKFAENTQWEVQRALGHWNG